MILKGARKSFEAVTEANRGKKVYKRAAIGLFGLLVVSLLAIFGVSFAAGMILKDSKLEESFEGTAVMKATDGTPVSVSVTEEAKALFDMPTMTMDELVHLAVFFAYADMRADASVGVWVPYTAKIASAFKKGDDVLTLKSSAGDVITVDRASQTATLKTTEGAVFPLGREPEEQTTRRLAVIQLGRGRQNRRRGRGGFMAYGGAIVFGGAASGGGR